MSKAALNWIKSPLSTVKKTNGHDTLKKFRNTGISKSKSCILITFKTSEAGEHWEKILTKNHNISMKKMQKNEFFQNLQVIHIFTIFRGIKWNLVLWLRFTFRILASIQEKIKKNPRTLNFLLLFPQFCEKKNKFGILIAIHIPDTGINSKIKIKTSPENLMILHRVLTSTIFLKNGFKEDIKKFWEKISSVLHTKNVQNPEFFQN